MNVKILLFDDIFSEAFRKSLSAEQLAWDDNWVSALEQMLTSAGDNGEVFELAKSGDIDSWAQVIRRERPDIVLIDLFWPEEAARKFGTRNYGMDVALEVIPQIKAAYPNLPLICHTVKPGPEILDRAYAAGANFFLEKVALPLPEVQSPLKYIIVHQLRSVQELRNRNARDDMRVREKQI